MMKVCERDYKIEGLKIMVNYKDILTFLISIFGLVLSNLQVIELSKISNNVEKLFIYNFFICSAIVFMNVYILLNKRKVSKIEEDKKCLEEKNKNLLEVTDNIRCFKHDFNNIIQAMNGYIQTEDIPSLKKYVKKMIKDVNETDDSKIGNEFLLNNKAITNLLKSKNVKAKKENIDIKFEIMFELKLLKKYEYELIRVLGIFLDNAIEAQREEDDKVIEVLFFKDANCKRIIIENTCTKNIDIDKIYTKEFSTKKGNTGLGLWEVKNFVDNNPNFSLETTLENNCFKHTLYIL